MVRKQSAADQPLRLDNQICFAVYSAAHAFNRVYKPLQEHSSDLLTTLWAYLDNGRSLEGTARELFVHPNTVRYRLKRISEIIGYDATGAREALILQAALIVGSISGNRRG